MSTRLARNRKIALSRPSAIGVPHNVAFSGRFNSAEEHGIAGNVQAIVKFRIT